MRALLTRLACSKAKSWVFPNPSTFPFLCLMQIDRRKEWMNEITTHTNKGDRRCEITRGQRKEREREWEWCIGRKHNTSKTPHRLLGHLRRKQNCYLPPTPTPTPSHSPFSLCSLLCLLFFFSNVSIRTWLSSCCLKSFGVESLKEICHPTQPFNFKQEMEKRDRKR